MADIEAQETSAVLTSFGGAYIGWMNVSWPLARLTATGENLSISAVLIGSYTFSPDELNCLKPYSWFPFLGRGIQVIHTNPTYPRQMVFWCPGSPERLIEKIHALGFRPSAPSAAIPKRDGIPFRWAFIIAVVAIWNTLCILDGFVPGQAPMEFGFFFTIGLAMLFLTFVAVARSKAVQTLALKPGRSVSEIKPLLNVMQLICGFFFIASLAIKLAG
jgi:hypothetical protein